jgi:hypothetical protein
MTLRTSLLILLYTVGIPLALTLYAAIAVAGFIGGMALGVVVYE